MSDRFQPSRRWQGVLKALPLALLLVLAFGRLARAQTPPPANAVASAFGPVVVIHLDDTIQQISAEYVTRGLAYANAHHAAAVVLTLSTPGGLDTSMRAIIQAILASPVPVIGYVSPSGARAASAGFFILMSCDVAAMAPGTNTGAAHPVILGGPQPGATEAAKMQNDAAAYIRTLASQRHHNVAMAEKAVVSSASYTDQEALSAGLVDLVSPSLDQLLATLNGRVVSRAGPLTGTSVTLHLAGAPRVNFAMSLRERILDMNSTLAYLLLMGGALLIYIEFTHPGMFAPGVIGLILVVLAAFSLSLLPISWAAVGLLLAGLVLFGLEAHFPTHGVLVLGGVICVALGGLMLVDTSVPQLRVAWTAAIGVALGFGLISLFLVQLVLRARHNRVMSGAQGLLGEIGLTLAPLTPSGSVRVHGEIWDAIAVVDVPAGVSVRVCGVRGLRLEVEPAHRAHPDAP